jgi:hypothetical protein
VRVPTLHPCSGRLIDQVHQSCHNLGFAQIFMLQLSLQGRIPELPDLDPNIAEQWINQHLPVCEDCAHVVFAANRLALLETEGNLTIRLAWQILWGHYQEAMAGQQSL